MSVVQTAAPAAPLFYSRKEACQMLSIGPTTLHDLFNKGRIRPVKLGTKTLITAGELLRFAQEVVEGGAE